MKDGILYGELLEQIAGAPGQKILKETSPEARSQAIVSAVDQLTPFRIITDPKRILLHCHQIICILTLPEITTGNNKLGVALLASLCDVAPKLTVTAEQTSKINATVLSLDTKNETNRYF